MADTSFYLRKINSTVKTDREESLTAILTFLEDKDVYLDTEEMRRIKSFVLSADTPEARKISELIVPTIDKDLIKLLDKEADKRADIDEKELLEASCFYRQVSKVLEKARVTPKTIIDLCAGNCLAGALWLLNGADKVYFVDKADSNHSRKVRKQLDLNGYNTCYNYNNADIFDENIRTYFENAQKGSAIAVSIHACGSLSDRIIELSIQYNVPFAVVPCCQGRGINNVLRTSKYTLEDAQFYSRYFEDISGYSDLMRINYAVEQGYKIILRALPREITDKNRIIMGIPPN